MAHVEVVPDLLGGREPYHLLTSLVVPRPIAWVSTLSEEGVRNLAPHSYFNIVSSDPPIVHFTSTGVKDTLRNCRATGEFVVNMVGRELVEEMNLTATNFPPEEDEFSWSGLEGAASTRVAPERVAAARAALECKVERILSIGNGNMVFGSVVAVHIDEAVLRNGRVDPHLLHPVGRLGAALYTDAAADIFELKRKTYEELQDPFLK